MHSHGMVDAEESETHSEEPLDEVMNRFDISSSETDREGSEMSGDEHSSGHQGIDLPPNQVAGQPEVIDRTDVIRRENDDNVIIFRQRTPKSQK